MDARVEKFDCSEKQIKLALRNLVISPNGYSQFFSQLTKYGMGLRAPDGNSLLVHWGYGYVSAEVIFVEHDPSDTLDMFFKTLSRLLEPASSTVKPQSAEGLDSPIKVGTSSAPVEEISRPSCPLSELKEWSSSVRANVSEVMTGWLKKSISLKATLGASLIVALIMALIGGGVGYASRDPVKQPEYQRMILSKNLNVKELKRQVSNGETKIQEMQQTINDLQPYKDKYDEKLRELASQMDDVNKRKSDLDNKQKELDSKSAQLDQRSKDLDEREASVLQQKTAPAPQETSASSESSGSYSSAGSSSGGSIYYKNCKAVWDALGHGITSNDPGYAPDLDSDHDGKACEYPPSY